MPSIAEYSKLYVANGFYLFPAKNKVKEPRLSEWQTLSTIDPLQWLEWEQEFHGCQWGIDTEKSGLIVWDPDLYKDGTPEAWESICAGRAIKTFQVKTPQGGMHYYFRGEIVPSIKLKISGKDTNIDVKSRGGLVILPPSPGYVIIDPNAEVHQHPQLLMDVYKKHEAVSAGERFKMPEALKKGSRNTTLHKQASSLLGQGLNYSVVLSLDKLPTEIFASLPWREMKSRPLLKVHRKNTRQRNERKKSPRKRNLNISRKTCLRLTILRQGFVQLKKTSSCRLKTETGRPPHLRKNTFGLDVLTYHYHPRLLWIIWTDGHPKKKTTVRKNISLWMSQNGTAKKRIGLFLKALNITNMSEQHAYELMCHWLVGIWRRIKNPKERNWVLVLHGPQNIGKDWWIRELLGGWDSRYYFETLNVFTDEVRTFMHLDGKVLIHMSEFDEAKKWTPGFLKDLITKESLSYIGKYQSEVRRIPARHTLVASANRLDFLTDTSGSSRFFILDTPKINFDYPMSESLQVIAQSKRMYEDGYTASKEALDSLEVEQDRVTPPDIDALILQDFKYSLQKLEEIRAQNYGKSVSDLDSSAKKFTHKELEDVWKLLCDQYKKSRKIIIGIVKPVYGRRTSRERYFTLETH